MQQENSDLILLPTYRQVLYILEKRLMETESTIKMYACPDVAGLGQFNG
jgi:hypothetical protein